MEERNATLNELINEIDRPLWRQAAMARLAEIFTERDKFKTDFESMCRVINAGGACCNCVHGDYFPEELCELHKELEDAEIRISLMQEALQHVKNQVDGSENWWMDCPDRGGIDMVLVNKALLIIT